MDADAGGRRRLFVGIGIPEAEASILARELVRWAAPDGVPGRPVPPESWHLTVRFIGDVDDVTCDRLLAALDAADLGESFDAVLSEVGAFPNPRRATVLWVGVRDGRELERVAAVVEDAVVGAGLEESDRPFVPHLTLARIRPDEDVRPFLARTPPADVRFRVDHVTLYESHLGRGPARYEAVERFPLG